MYKSDEISEGETRQTMPQKNALIVDDSKMNCAYLEFTLEDDGFEVQKAFSGLQALKALDNTLFDLILLDLEMPEMDGLQTLQHIRAKQQFRAVPVIMVTAVEEDESLIQCLDQGAYDYILKPVNPPQLLARIRSAMHLAETINELTLAKSELEKTSIELNRLACIDSLSECANRRHFLELCDREFSKARRYNQSLAVMMLDIDHFKTVNDQYGHSIGDSVIQWLGRFCKAQARTSDIVGRMGGEEFASCCPGVNAEGAAVLAERIREGCEQTKQGIEGKHFITTVSIGIAEYTEQDKAFTAILNRSDDQLYQAKRGGRNRVCFAKQGSGNALQ